MEMRESNVWICVVYLALREFEMASNENPSLLSHFCYVVTRVRGNRILCFPSSQKWPLTCYLNMICMAGSTNGFSCMVHKRQTIQIQVGQLHPLLSSSQDRSMTPPTRYCARLGISRHRDATSVPTRR
jgi:hypothetical protein